MTVSTALLDRLRELRAKATPGPWEAKMLMVMARRETLFHAGTTNNFCPPRPEEVVANNALIVELVNNADALLAAVERVATLEARLRLIGRDPSRDPSKAAAEAGAWRPTREEIARTVDTAAWSDLDRLGSVLDQDDPRLVDCIARCDDSLKCADAILALPAPPTAEAK